MKRKIIGVFVVLQFFVEILVGKEIYNFFTENKSPIVGLWLTEDKESKIQIYEDRSKFFGKIIWEKDAKNQKNVGLILLKDLEKATEIEWKNGKVQDPDSGKWYDCSFSLIDNQTVKMKAKLGFMSYSEKWTKTN
jgi:uncharacterized protein (DUF2147 family)